MAARRCRIRVSGRVQGVGYRFFAVREAQQYGVSGWVRNTRDGAVEAEAQGEAASVRAFVAVLEQGPSFGRVDELISADIPLVKGDRVFTIEH